MPASAASVRAVWAKEAVGRRAPGDISLGCATPAAAEGLRPADLEADVAYPVGYLARPRCQVW